MEIPISEALVNVIGVQKAPQDVSENYKLRLAQLAARKMRF